MNLVRSVITLFLLVLLTLAAAGWTWAGNQPPEKMYGARAVLGVCAFAAVGSIVLLWTARKPEVD